MRVIGGIARGRNLLPAAAVTRPTSDRAREAFFSSIEAEFGELNHLRFLDLFSGTGAMAIEALSRGAAYVVCVEENEKAAQVIEDNFHNIFSKNSERTFNYHIYHLGVEKYLKTVHEAKAFDVIYLDPPYEFTNEKLAQLLVEIAELKLLAPRGVVAVERSRSKVKFAFPDNFQQTKVRNYGQADIFFGEYSENSATV
jgi:16S rRNA (guanine966-N2)-methyltransferase